MSNPKSYSAQIKIEFESTYTKEEIERKFGRLLGGCFWKVNDLSISVVESKPVRVS